MDEGGAHFRFCTGHLIPYQINFVALGILAFRQFLHIPIFNGQCHPVFGFECASLLHRQNFVLILWHHSDCDGILKDDILVYTYEKVCFGTYPFLAI